MANKPLSDVHWNERRKLRSHEENRARYEAEKKARRTWPEDGDTSQPSEVERDWHPESE